MRFAGTIILCALIALGACNRPQPDDAHQPPAAAQPPAPPVATPVPQPPSVAEPRGPIDPKSAEAAGQVVQHYGALIEQGRWTESWKLWSDSAAAKEFDRNWRDSSEVHLEIGELGEMQGAVGSSYVTEPVVFYGKLKSGSDFRRAAEVVLRRVNDVPGSTEAQRRWHIERIELTPGG